MCGRLNVHDSHTIQALMKALGMPFYPDQPPRYNVTPSSMLPVLFRKEIALMAWGIEFGRFRHPNSKAATLIQKPYLQKLLLGQRCIVPVNRFYEWPDLKTRPQYKLDKTRFCVHTPEEVMFLAGIYKMSPRGYHAI